MLIPGRPDLVLFESGACKIVIRMAVVVDAIAVISMVEIAARCCHTRCGRVTQ